jgi:hypothetical protein
LSRIHPLGSFATRLFALPLLLLCFLIGVRPLSAQATLLPTTAVLSTGSAVATVTLPSGTLGSTIASIRVLGEGVENLDFTNGGGGSCSVGGVISGPSCTVDVVFSPASPGNRWGAIVLLDGSSNVLATQFLSGVATGALGVFVPGIINTVAGDGVANYSGDGGSATTAELYLPYGIAVDGAGTLFIADKGNNLIRCVNASTQNITTCAGVPYHSGYSGDGGSATAAWLSGPTSVVLDAAGNLFFADQGNNIIRRVDKFTGIITTYAGTPGQSGYHGDGNAAASATLNNPNGLSFDVNGNLYIADTGNNVIRMVAPGTGVLGGNITTVAGNGTAGFSNGTNNVATTAMLNAPLSATPLPPATPGATPAFYIADQINNRIRLVDSTGHISTIAGSASGGWSGDTQPASQAQLYLPASVVVDVAGNIYIGDNGNNVVRKINASTTVINTIAGNGSESFSGDGGSAKNAGLSGIYAVALDSQGNLYFADAFHQRIRKLSANSAILQYPVMRTGKVSNALQQTLENDGNASLQMSGFPQISDSQLDPISTTCSVATPLAALDQCVIGVDFTPHTVGNLVTGELDVDSNAVNTPGVINLSGQVLNVNPTTATLSSSANPSTLGNPVVFTLNVSNAGEGAMTGAVTLSDGSNTIGTGTIGAGGAFSFPAVSSLTAGSHTLTAQYAGDNNNEAATATLTQTVNQPNAPTATVLTPNPFSGTAGAPIAFTVTVNTVTANSGSGNITGTIAIQRNGVTLGSGTLTTLSSNSSSGTITLSNLPVGTDSLVAVYTCDTNNYAGSSSGQDTGTISTATTQTTIASSTPSSIAGVPITLTSSVTSNGGVPTGTVTFYDGTRNLGTAGLTSATALLSVSGSFWTVVGTHSLTAVYNGDANDGTSSSTPLNQTITIAPTGTVVRSSLSPAGLGANVTFTATVTSQGGVPTGAVQFFADGNAIGSSNLTASGASAATASFATAALALGQHSITAAYVGDASNSGSTSAAIQETIASTTDGVSLTSSANPAIVGAALTLTARVTGNGSTPTGTVALVDGATTIATQPVPLNGIVAFTDPALAIGSHILTAAYSGDANHAGTTSTQLTESILQATTTALTATASNLIGGQSVTFSASVVGASSQPLSGSPMGTVKFLDAGTVLGAVTVNGSGNASFTTTSLRPGNHTITAAFTGDTNDAPSTSATVPVGVVIATTSTTLTTSANPIFSGSTLTLSSTVTGNGGAPTGTVTFKDGGATLTSVQVSSAGTATFSISTLSPGIHQLSAVYSGDPLDAASTSPTTAQQIAERTTVTLTSSENPSLLQDTVVLSITVTNGSNAYIPTGSVTLTDGTTTLANLQLNAAGTASYTLQSPALGTHTLVASYGGDNQNSPASSSPLIQTVNLRPTVTSFTPSVTFLSAGQSMTLISVVQGTGSLPPTGTVTFMAGSTVLGTATLNSDGLATTNIVPLQGIYATVAQYSGDSLYAGSVSAPTTITVGPTKEFIIALTPPTMTMASGSHASIGINITTANVFNDTLVLGCAGLPVDATCTFSTPQVSVSNGASPSLTVMVDTGNPLGAGAQAKLDPENRISTAYACALPVGAFFALLIGCNRRRLSRINPKLALFLLILMLGAGSATLSGCGATNFTQNHTPAGSYTFQIVASGNKTGVTQTAIAQMTVTQ